MARRTLESGDYYGHLLMSPYQRILNDNLGNGGVYNAGQFTYGSSVPSDDLAFRVRR